MASKMTKIISFSNHKGGVGKTCSVANIGAGLASHKKKVLVIDLDPQANLSLSFGIKNPEKNIYGALSAHYGLKEALTKVNEFLHIIPSHLDLSGAETELNSESGRELILKELIEPVKSTYDYILIDSPPSLGLLTLNALTAANEVYIPIQAQFLAIQGLAKLNEVIGKIQRRMNKNLKIGGVFLTQFDSRKVLNRDVSKTVEEHFKQQVFKTKIRDNVALAEAPSSGMDIFRYNPKSIGASDYTSLVNEIIEREDA